MNTRFYHSVYFWLRENGEEDDAQKSADGCRAYFANIPGIVGMHIGFPAGTPGDAVDNSYGVALLMEFEREAADVYEVHPDHQRFIADFRHLWSRVQVYALPA